jgi:hypothetical protein
MKFTDLITESQLPMVGRRYQHIEDLVFTNGSIGGLHAVERLKQIATEGTNIELKWDGSPVLYWGRDSQGQFSMMPKNAWDYVKRGKTTLDNGVSTIMQTAEDVEQFILNTGKSSTVRESFARRVASLWPYLEKASPVFGYVEGSVLFDHIQRPTFNTKTGEYEFTPNITSFHIPADSQLGQRIAESKIMVAVTGYYDNIGSITESRFQDAATLTTRDVIVQGTTFVERAPLVSTLGIDLAERLIEEHAEVIDKFLTPVPGMSKPGEILYKFFNQNLRVPGVKHKFQEWAIANLSSKQAQKILSQPGLNTMLGIVETLTQEKMQVIEAISSIPHNSIRQTKPEGYAQAHPGKEFKRDLPGQFIKMIDQANWSPRK